jgi:hypothetical protein
MVHALNSTAKPPPISLLHAASCPAQAVQLPVFRGDEDFGSAGFARKVSPRLLSGLEPLVASTAETSWRWTRLRVIRKNGAER